MTASTQPPGNHSAIEDCRRRYKAAAEMMAAGKTQDALLACRTLCERYPGFAPGWYLGSRLAQQVGNGDKALEFATRAVQLAADGGFYKVHQANCLLALRRQTEALELARQVAAAQPQDKAVLQSLALFFTNAGEHASARDYYRKLVEADPKDSLMWFNLASTERFLGNIDAAEQTFDRGLAHNPGSCEPYYLRAGLRTQTPEHNHIDELEALLQRDNLQWIDRVQLHYALAKEQEDLGNDRESFRQLNAGAQLRRKHMDYRVERDIEVMEQLQQTFTATAVASASGGCDSDAAIFILGLPRTGTTLAERILASHPQVVAAGELNDFAAQLIRLVRQANGGKRERLEEIKSSINLNFAQLGKAYLASANPGTAPHFIDKMPLNFLYCGLIALAFPNAKIIEMVRHPMDTCYAIYKQYFTLAYPFSYDLTDLGRYFVAYEKLMRHWRALFPDRIYRLHYEELVREQQRQTEQLLTHCGLPWHDGCVTFERNPTASTTASAVQVRRPVYDSSIGKWRRFEAELAELKNLLSTQGITL